MSSRLQLDMRNLSLGRRHPVNAYEVEASIGVIASNTVWSMPERLECEVLQKARYTLTFTFKLTVVTIRQFALGLDKQKWFYFPPNTWTRITKAVVCWSLYELVQKQGEPRFFVLGPGWSDFSLEKHFRHLVTLRRSSVCPTICFGVGETEMGLFSPNT